MLANLPTPLLGIVGTAAIARLGEALLGGIAMSALVPHSHRQHRLIAGTYAGHVSAVIAAASAPTSSSIPACPPRRSSFERSDLMPATRRSPWKTNAL
jgi:hypothetical protein